jgi:hypothetical protein
MLSPVIEINERFAKAVSAVFPTMTKMGEFCARHDIDVRNFIRAIKNCDTRPLSLA